MPVVRLNIRWKYFLTLLVLCLFPLAVVTVASHWSMLSVESTVSQDAQDAFSSISSKSLLQTACTQAAMLRRTRQAVNFSLLLLADDVRLAYAAAPPGMSKPPLLFDGKSLAAAPSPSVPADSKDSQEPVFEPLFQIWPGVAEQEVAQDLALLAGLGPRFNAMYGQMPDVINRMGIILDKGLRMVFPARAGFPEDWTIMSQPGYMRLDMGDDPVWSIPLVREKSSRATLTITQNLKDAKGRRLGTAIMEINATGNAESGQAAPQLPGMQSLLVLCMERPDTEKTGLLLMASRQSGAMPWIGQAGTRWLESPDIPEFNRMLASILNEESGAAELDFDGTPCLWAWAPAGECNTFINIMPVSILGGKAKQIAHTLSTYTRYALVLSGLAALVTVLLVALAAFVGSRRFTAPLVAMVRGVSRVSKGDFSVRISMETGDEWDRLIRGFNDMIPMLEETISWRRKINVAREVQQSLLPKAPPLVPGLDLAGRSVPADRVGGDYFDFLQSRRDHRLVVAVGDITGHGLAAALLMATARALIRRRSRRAGSLAKIMTDINKQLAPDVADSGKFMTLFLAEIDVGKMVLRWANAGHDPAMVYDPANGVFESLPGGGLLLGPFEDSEYEQYRRPISPGQIIILGTDGIWESTGKDNTHFGKERLKQTVEQNAHLPAKDIVDAVFDAVALFRGDQPQEDDITLVAVKVLDDVLDGMPKEYKQLIFPQFKD